MKLHCHLKIWVRSNIVHRMLSGLHWALCENALTFQCCADHPSYSEPTRILPYDMEQNDKPSKITKCGIMEVTRKERSFGTIVRNHRKERSFGTDWAQRLVRWDDGMIGSILRWTVLQSCLHAHTGAPCRVCRVWRGVQRESRAPARDRQDCSPAPAPASRSPEEGTRRGRAGWTRYTFH